MLDIGIAVAIALLLAVTAYLGTHLTMHPAETPRQKFWYKTGFAVCGLVGCALIGVQTWRNNQTQDDLRGRLSRIEKNTKTPPSVQVTNNVPAPQIVFPPVTQAPSRVPPVVSLNCVQTMLPIEVPASRHITMIDPQFPGGFAIFTAPPSATGEGLQKFWPGNTANASFVYTCEFVNYSGQPLFNVKASFKMYVSKPTISTHDGMTIYGNGQPVTIKNYPIDVGDLAPNGGSFKFEITNSSILWAEVEAPDHATYETAQGAEAITLNIKKTGAAISRITLQIGGGQ